MLWTVTKSPCDADHPNDLLGLREETQRMAARASTALPLLDDGESHPHGRADEVVVRVLPVLPASGIYLDMLVGSWKSGAG